MAKRTSSNIADNNFVPFSANYQGINNKLICGLNCGTATEYNASAIRSDCTDVSSAQGTTAGQHSDTVYVSRNADLSIR